MKKLIILTTSVLLLFAFISCKKDVIEPDISVADPTDSTETGGSKTPPDSLGTEKPDTQTDKRVFIRTNIKAGEILYDSIPAQLIVRSWDAKDEMDYKMFYIAGTQPISLPAKGVRFQFTLNKWGGRAERTLTQAEVKDGALYTIDLQLAAKKLKSVVEVKITSESAKPQTKTDYEYNANGEISQRLVWGKKADNSNYLIQKEIFTYTNGHITGIKSFDEGNTLLKTLTVRYDMDGRVIALEEIKGSEKTAVTASYFPLETGGNIRNNYRIDAQLDLYNGKHTDYYSKTMSGGKMIYDIYTSHNGGNVEGYYDYDSGINPYVHLKIPELLFSQYDRHNKTFPRKQYGHGRPEYEAVDFKYTYDADGYPKELLTKYRFTGSKMDAYTIRTIFTY